MEVHALVNGRVSDLPSLLKEVTSLSELVHLDAQLQERSHKRVPNSSVFLFIKFNMHLKKKKKKITDSGTVVPKLESTAGLNKNNACLCTVSMDKSVKRTSR